MSSKQALGEKKPTAYAFKSRYGSTSEMVVRQLENGKVICKDEFGEYETVKSKLDSGEADPARWDLAHRGVKLQ